MKTYLNILILLFFLLCWGTLFLNSSFFVSAWIIPKWYAFIFVSAAILATVSVFSIFSDIKKLRLSKLVSPFCLIISALCTVQALYGIAQYMHLYPAFEEYKVTGSFENPAGFAASLCAGFPFFFYFLTQKEKWKRVVTIGGMAAVCMAIILSGSRAGILGLTVVCLGYFFNKFRISKKQKMLLGIFLVIAATCLYFIKKDSANGRLLIWQCCWEMIKEKPYMGHGAGGFTAGYMNYQAEYFEKNPDSKYVMIADNINRPFNEYIKLIVNHGLVGFLLFLLCVFCLIWAYRRNTCKNLLTRIACLCLTAIAVFAFFSYPLWYPFVWVTGLFSCSVILFQGNNRRFILFKKAFFPVLLLLLILAICIKSYDRMTAEIKWCTTAHKSLAGQTEQMLPQYQSLYSQLCNNELFLYNYAAELHFAGHYEKSLSIALECERLWADYDLQMLIADDYRRLRDYAAAEQCYRKAAAMCPVKFVPLYLLAKMYDVTGHRSEAIALATQIINKPVKISSPEITDIQREMMQLIEEN